MTRQEFDRSLKALVDAHERFLAARTQLRREATASTIAMPVPSSPLSHAPISWRYDMCYDTNPFLLERIGVNAAFNAGAIEHEGRFSCSSAWKARTGNPSSRSPIAERDRQFPLLDYLSSCRRPMTPTPTCTTCA